MNDARAELEARRKLQSALNASDARAELEARRALIRVTKSAPQSAKQPSTQGSIIGPIMQGLNFGWTDEAGALGAYIGTKAAPNPAARKPWETPSQHAERVSGGSYLDRDKRAKANALRELEKQRGDLKAFRSRHPGYAGGAEFAGALITGGPALLAAKGIAPRVSTAMVEGGIAGSGAADQNKLAGGLLSAGVGGTVAGTIPGAAALTHKGVTRFNESIVRPVIERFSRDPQKAGDRIVRSAFEGLSPEELAKRQTELGPLATPADIGGPQAMGLAQGAIGQSPKTLSTARQLADTRRAGQTERLTRDINEATGNRQSYLDSFDEISARQRENSRVLYERSNARVIDPDSELIDIMNRPGVRKAIPKAIEDAANEGRMLPQLENIILKGDDWKVSTENFPDMQALDSVKKTLDRMVNSAYKSNDPGASALKSARDALRNKLDDLNPDYRAAREVYAGDAALKTSIEEGEKLLSRKTREVKAFTRNLSESEREAYLTGAVEAIKEKMGRARTGEIGEFRFLEANNAKEKLRLLFPEGKEDTKQLNRLMTALKRERTFAENETAWVRGSQTQLRDAGTRALAKDVMMPGTVEAVNSPTAAMISGALASGKRALGSYPQRTVDYVGDMLFTPNNQQQLMQLMQQNAIQPRSFSQIANQYSRYPSLVAPSFGLLSVSGTQ